MSTIFSVYGKWMMNKESCNFIVNQEKGTKLFTIRDDLKYDDMIQMVIEDFGIDRLVSEVEMSYAMPEEMLKNMPKDTPPIFVNNDRQLEIFLKISKSMPTRLCISVKHVNQEASKQSFNFREVHVAVEQGAKANKTRNFCEDVDGHSNNEEIEVVVPSKGIYVDQWFKDKSELSWSIRMLSIERKFRYFVSKSDTKLYVVRCKDKNCKWMIRSSKNKGSDFFWVTKYIDNHTCFPGSGDYGPQASSKVISQLLLENFGNCGLSMKPKSISTCMKKRYGLDMKYWKIWKARENARELVWGSPESSYAQLPIYIHKIKKANPGTIAHLEVDDLQRFKYLFFSFGASKKGYEFLRKVVVVDGTFLKGKYKGVLLIATAQDGDSHIYPLAFGIVDSENDASWEWFFTNLRSVVPDDPKLVMISDRHSSIAKAIPKVYPLAQRGICTYHLQKNIITKFRGRKIIRLVNTASKAYTTTEFNVIFAEIRRQNQQLGTYLDEANVRLWSRAYFPGEKYNITTSNAAESLNALLKEPRELPIVSMIEVIRNTMTRWFYERRENAGKYKSTITPKVAEEIKKRCNMSDTFDVQSINVHEFQVNDGSRNYVVNIQQMTCTCRVFDVEKIPCNHAVKAALSRGIDPVLLVHHYYTKSVMCAAYSESIKPMEVVPEVYEIPPHIADQLCLPPETRRSAGRPKKRRYQGIDELLRKKARKQQTCSRCQRMGHNRATCDFSLA